MELKFSKSLTFLSSSIKRMGYVSLFLCTILLCLPLQSLSFKVSELSSPYEFGDSRLVQSRSLMKRSSDLHGCRLHCQKCREIFGYMHYNYVDCVYACDRSGGSKWDGQCEGFRTEDKRTAAQEQQIEECRQMCANIGNTPKCRNFRYFYQVVAAGMCEAYCLTMNFEKAIRVTCESVKRQDDKMFRIIE